MIINYRIDRDKEILKEILKSSRNLERKKSHPFNLKNKMSNNEMIIFNKHISKIIIHTKEENNNNLMKMRPRMIMNIMKMRMTKFKLERTNIRVQLRISLQIHPKCHKLFK